MTRSSPWPAPRPWSGSGFRPCWCLLALLLPLALPTQLRAESVLKPDDVLAICGDSITVTKTYPCFIEEYFLMCQPVPRLRVLAFGAGGESARGLLERLDIDVLRFKPTVMTTMYGMNDAQYHPLDKDHEDGYRSGEEGIIAKAKQAGVRTIILGSPTCVDACNYHRDFSTAAVYNDTLRQLGVIGHGIADADHILFADVHSVFERTMNNAKAANGPGFQLCGDGVHPLQDGYIAVAYAFLRAFGCDGAIGTITLDMRDGSATGTPGQKIVSATAGSVQVESTRYPFCFWGNPSDANATVSVLKFIPFNQDFNRYLLVVKHLSAAKAKVTWGGQSREFATADLAAGINLAAEFIDNPFVAQFQKVDRAVHAQQDTQEILDHEFIREMPRLKEAIGEDDAWERLITKGMEHDLEMDRAAAALVVPITHTITITAVP